MTVEKIQNKTASEANYPARWWHTLNDEASKIQCDLCPRECKLKDGDHGFCFIRKNVDGQLVLTSYGKTTGIGIDPIEKKPLYQFFPGTKILSFGTAGCNLGCSYCQNWSISKSKETQDLGRKVSPASIAELAVENECKGVAFTYNDPIIWAEFAIDCAKECRKRDLKTIAVTNGYISKEAREEFFSYIDAANVDLKAFTERFYRKLTLSHLEPVLDTLKWLASSSNVWLELTNLVIPGENDSPTEIESMCYWIRKHLGPDVPLHFTAFFPSYRLMNRPSTPTETLIMAREIALEAGLNYVYIGNILDEKQGSNTYCPGCNAIVISRDNYFLDDSAAFNGKCQNCKFEIAGYFHKPFCEARR